MVAGTPTERPRSRREIREAARQAAAAARPAPDDAEQTADPGDAGPVPDGAPAPADDGTTVAEATSPAAAADAALPEPELVEVPVPEHDLLVVPMAPTPVIPEVAEPGLEDPASTTAPAPPPRTSRAGRDLPVAIGVGLGMGALFLLSLFVLKEAFVALAVVAVGGALWEFGVALRTRGIRIPFLPLVVGSTGMLVSAYVAGAEALVVAFMLTAGGVFVWRVIDGGGLTALRDAGAGIFAAAWLPFLASFAMLLLAAPTGEWQVLYAVCLVVANDTGGYAAGVMFGKHPMAPSISPKKSWEGFAGSALLAAVVGLGLMAWFFDGPLWAGAVIGLLTVAAATVGDLSESLIKRDLGLKDMGALLPGHGGIMDRLDSLLVAAPVVYGSLTVTLTYLV